MQWGHSTEARSASCFAQDLLLLNVIAKENILVAKIQLAVGDGGMGPGVSLAPVGLIEPAMFDKFFWIGLHQDHGSAFVSVEEPAVGIGNRTLAGFALF